jgi:hypothetical protein
LKHKVFTGVVVLQIAVLLLLFAGRITLKKHRADIDLNQQLVKSLMLTDLSIWTEARYTRHPSQTDFFSPFQDFPAAIDHFPAGSIFPPPSMVNFLGVKQVKTNNGGG